MQPTFDESPKLTSFLSEQRQHAMLMFQSTTRQQLVFGRAGAVMRRFSEA
jgi:hypothetical protein